MKKHVFFTQKENLTLLSLFGLIILSFALMHFNYNQNNTDSSRITTSKVKMNSSSQQHNIPHFLPAL